MHTSNTLAACVGIGPTRLALGADTVVLMASPLAHQTGYLYGFLMPIRIGARTVLQDIWDPAVAARIIHDEQATFTIGATPFLADLAHSEALERYPTASLEIFATAGAPVPRVLVQTATERLGASVVAGWGMSENGLVTCTLPGDPPEKIFGTDGGPWAGMEVRVVGEDGEPAPPGVPGALQARGAANFVGYLKRPEAYATDRDGWFDTGDIATMDESGYIRITSRAKDIIIRGGENVPVVEVEELLYRHDAVRDAAIVAMPDPRLGERGLRLRHPPARRVPRLRGDAAPSRGAAAREAVLAGAPRDHRRDAAHPERQDPEVQAARAGRRLRAGRGAPELRCSRGKVPQPSSGRARA